MMEPSAPTKKQFCPPCTREQLETPTRQPQYKTRVEAWIRVVICDVRLAFASQEGESSEHHEQRLRLLLVCDTLFPSRGFDPALGISNGWWRTTRSAATPIAAWHRPSGPARCAAGFRQCGGPIWPSGRSASRRLQGRGFAPGRRAALCAIASGKKGSRETLYDYYEWATGKRLRACQAAGHLADIKQAEQRVSQLQVRNVAG